MRSSANFDCRTHIAAISSSSHFNPSPTLHLPNNHSSSATLNALTSTPIALLDDLSRSDYAARDIFFAQLLPVTRICALSSGVNASRVVGVDGSQGGEQT